VGEQEDEHLYHTMGWARELWIESLGMPAVLPPPEEEKNVKSATGARPGSSGAEGDAVAAPPGSANIVDQVVSSRSGGRPGSNVLLWTTASATWISFRLDALALSRSMLNAACSSTP
jgi:hypothetical protein